MAPQEGKATKGGRQHKESGGGEEGDQSCPPVVRHTGLVYESRKSSKGGQRGAKALR